MKKLFPLIFLSLILVVPFVSAQFYYGYFNPSDLLDNPWFIFTAFFAVFFGVIYASLGRVIGGTTPTLVIAAAIALVISAGMQRNWYFLQQPIMFWAVLLIVLLVASVFIKVLFGGGGMTSLWVMIGLLLILWGLWPFFKNMLPIDAVASIPYQLIEFLDRTWFLAFVVLIVGSIIGFRAWGYFKAAERGQMPWRRKRD
jgi:hypothetical protein